MLKSEEDKLELNFEFMKTTIRNFMIINRKIPSVTENITINKIYNSVYRRAKSIAADIQNWPHLLTLAIEDIDDMTIKNQLIDLYRHKIFQNRKREWQPYGLALNNKNLLKYKYPHIAVEFHPTLNYDTPLKNIHIQSKANLWWFCEAKHQYRMTIQARAEEGKGCPVCSWGIKIDENEVKPKYFWQTIDPGFIYAKRVLIDFLLHHERIPKSSDSNDMRRIYIALTNTKVQELWNIKSWSEFLREIISEMEYKNTRLGVKLIESYNQAAERLKHRNWELIP